MLNELNQSVDLTEVLYVLRRRARLVAAATVLGLLLAVIVGIQQPVLYTATALVMVEPKEKRVVNVQSVVDQPGVDPAMLETHVKILESRDQGLRVVDDLKLTEDPEFQRQRGTTGIVNTVKRRALSVVTKYVPHDLLVTAGIAQETPDAMTTEGPDGRPTINSNSSLPRAPDEASEVVDPRTYALTVYEKRLSVSESGKSYVLEISFTSNDPEKAARIANESVSLYINSQLVEKRGAIANANEWLARRLEIMRAEYQVAQSNAQSYRAANDIITSLG